ncbi:uncharacterized protein NPIL_65001 [Nephila pilipes]|uniref:Uncharacterized protein n=1 Tax=Nephila pilipes TaxID=299642 RepID=A0A8X6Q3Y6_NEPPI|nr:uncharacterized protein NPIL_65001 [Nephila pilipes]
MIHQFAHASKTLQKPLQEVLGSLVTIVNYIKSSVCNTHLFEELCKNKNSDYEVLLFYTTAHWLSKGNVVGGDFELKNEIKDFLELKA